MWNIIEPSSLALFGYENPYVGGLLLVVAALLIVWGVSLMHPHIVKAVVGAFHEVHLITFGWEIIDGKEE